MSDSRQILTALLQEYDRAAFRKGCGRWDSDAWRLHFELQNRLPNSPPALYVHEPSNGRSRILVYRDHDVCVGRVSDVIAFANASPDPETELIYLSHEVGHHHSHLNGTFGDRSGQAAAATYAEEVRAWKIGERILVSHRFEQWHHFQQVARQEVEGYRVGLQIAPHEAEALEKKVRADLECWQFALPSGSAADRLG